MSLLHGFKAPAERTTAGDTHMLPDPSLNGH
jgi:hypothetical protein